MLDLDDKLADDPKDNDLLDDAEDDKSLGDLEDNDLSDDSEDDECVSWTDKRHWCNVLRYDLEPLPQDIQRGDKPVDAEYIVSVSGVDVTGSEKAWMTKRTNDVYTWFVGTRLLCTGRSPFPGISTVHNPALI